MGLSIADTAKLIASRNQYCKDRQNYCRAGGYWNWLASGIPSDLHPNYGLPCIGGTITLMDGSEVLSESCIHCGSTGNV